MGNIIGEGFNPKIKSQIEARQKVFGAANRSTDQLRYLNGRGTWIKLSSSVNVNNINDKIPSLSGVGDELAQNYVLFGGTAKNSGKTLRGGLEESYTTGDISQGYRPMAGITSIESKNRNRGSIRETTVNIKAYDTGQFNIIDLLYLRLGYTVLLEWGHTIYVDNNLTVKEITEADTLTSAFLNGTYDKNHEKLFQDIDNNKIKLQGNYDAIYGKITNFDWNFEVDGSYTITLKILSLGDIVESLKINRLAKGPKTEKAKKEEQENIEEAKTEEEIIEAYKNKDAITRLFFDAMEALENNGTTFQGEVYLEVLDILDYKKASCTGLPSDDEAKKLGFQFAGDFISLEEAELGPNDILYYVRLGGFLEYLKTKSLIYSGTQSLISLDNDQNTNLIFTTPYVTTSNPYKCIFKTNITVENIGWFDQLFQGNTDTYNIFSELPYNFQEVVGGALVGKLMNIYLNVKNLIEVIDQLRDENGSVSLYELLNNICEIVNESLGHVNKLSVAIDEENNNKVYFLDEVPLPNKDTIIKQLFPEASTELAIFEIYGYQENNASFVQNLSIKSEITNDLASMITIGAQANGSASNIDATAFSKWNEGLVDRIMPDKKSEPSDNSNNNSGTETNEDDDFEGISEEYEDFLQSLEDQDFDDNVEYFKDILANFLEAIQVKKSIEEKKASPTVGFIPINMGLDILGLSGMKIYQKFSITQKFLPYNYPSSIEFLIKGISHKVDDKGWVTSIDSLSIPKDTTSGSALPIPTSNPVPTTNTTLNTTSTGKGKNLNTPIQYFQSGLSADKAKQRVKLTRFLDDGTQTLGIMEIFAANEKNILYRLVTVELPWKNNKNGESSIPTGNYLCVSRSTAHYGKHFWLIGNKEGSYKRIPGSNPTDRTGVLIHMSPRAPGWLQGCIGPGLNFNNKNKKNAFENPNGTGTFYLEPSKAESQLALDKLVSTFYTEGGFKMDIVNIDNVASTALPKKITDPKVKKLAQDARFKSLFVGFKF